MVADIKKNIKSTYGKKMYALGLSSLLAVSGRPEFSAFLAPIVPQAVKKAAQLCFDIHKENDDDDDDGGGGGDGDGAAAAGGGDVFGGDDPFGGGGAAAAAGGDTDDDDDSSGELEDDEDANISQYDDFNEFEVHDEDPDDYETPIDNVDAKKYFMQCVSAGGGAQLAQLGRQVTCGVVTVSCGWVLRGRVRVRVRGQIDNGVPVVWFG